MYYGHGYYGGGMSPYLYTSAVQQLDLTGNWYSEEDGASYAIRQDGSNVYMSGLSHDAGNTFNNAFAGTLLGDNLIGFIADLPGSQNFGGGTNVAFTVSPDGRTISNPAGWAGNTSMVLSKQD